MIWERIAKRLHPVWNEKLRSWCWVYTHGISYALIEFPGRKNIPAHRLAWIEHYGPIPEGAQVHHRCEVKRCCNPKHLMVVSPVDHSNEHVRPTQPVWRPRRVLRTDASDEYIIARRAEGAALVAIAAETGLSKSGVWERLRSALGAADRATAQQAVEHGPPPPVTYQRPLKTHCSKGHPLSGDNLYVAPDKNNKQRRICRICAAERTRAWRANTN